MVIDTYIPINNPVKACFQRIYKYFLGHNYYLIQDYAFIKITRVWLPSTLRILNKHKNTDVSATVSTFKLKSLPLQIRPWSVK